MLALNVKIGFNEKKLQRQLLRHVAKIISRRLVKMMPRVETKIKFVVERAILNSPEALSLTGPLEVLNRELGVENASGKLQIIIQRWLEGIKITAKQIRVSSNNTLSGGLTIRGIKNSEVLGMDEASFISVNGFVVPWLEYLLLRGNEVVNREYEFNLVIGQGRNKSGIMIKNGVYQVPAEFAGTKENNFLTRSLDSIEPKIGQILRDEFLR